MAINRVRIPRDKGYLVQALVDEPEYTGPFSTYADVMAFAASVGKYHSRRISLQEISKEPGPINLDIFTSRGYEWLINLLAICETKDTKILAPQDAEAQRKRIIIFEEYAHGGLEELQQELKGATDYSERILLLLTNKRFPKPTPGYDFDLREFL